MLSGRGCGYGQLLQTGDCVEEQPRPVSHCEAGHCTLTQLLFAMLQPVTSHAQDWPQLTISHENCPVHTTWHGPGPQLTISHAWLPLHSIAHEALLLQLISARHAPGVLQRIVQSKPAGQTICALQAAPAAQSMVQLLPSEHDVHCEGHGGRGPSSTLESSGGLIGAGRSNRQEQASTSATTYQRMDGS
jgi:hypothetical protein